MFCRPVFLRQVPGESLMLAVLLLALVHCNFVMGCNVPEATRCNERYYACTAADHGNMSKMFLSTGPCSCAKAWMPCMMSAGGTSCSQMASLVFASHQFCEEAEQQLRARKK